jgi:leader peptidase (prepilin peptidase) / N-methyltransferase
MNPATFWYIMVFIFGAVIGSFLNVVIYRLHTGKSINTPSHCLSCGTRLQWYELFPVFSYVFLGGRCRTCGAYVPFRYLFVELLTGFSFLLLWHLMQADLVFFFLNAILAAVLIVIAVYDVRHTIIPDELALAVGAVALVFLGYGYTLVGDSSFIILNLLGGLGAGFFFFGLWYISKGRWLGLGDAKLALPLGVIAGFYGVFSMVVLSFWVGAIISLSILAVQHVLKKGKTSLLFPRHQLTIKSEVPFAPFLIIGFLLVHLFNADIFVITYYLLPF